MITKYEKKYYEYRLIAHVGIYLRPNREFIFLWSLNYDTHFFQLHRLHRRNKATENLVETLGGRHGSLDDKAANVLPALLEQGDQVVDGEHEVGNQLLLVHANVADGDTKAQHLLELELDGGLDVGDLLLHVLGVGDGGGELAGCEGVSRLRMTVLSIVKTYPWTDQDPADGESA